jgi:hypothetical protein
MISEQWKIPMKVEYTARDTPQKNAPVEVGFATIGGRARAMMAAGKCAIEFKHFLFPEAIMAATLLDGLNSSVSSMEWYGFKVTCMLWGLTPSLRCTF